MAHDVFNELTALQDKYQPFDRALTVIRQNLKSCGIIPTNNRLSNETRVEAFASNNQDVLAVVYSKLHDFAADENGTPYYLELVEPEKERGIYFSNFDAYQTAKPRHQHKHDSGVVPRHINYEMWKKNKGFDSNSL